MQQQDNHNGDAHSTIQTIRFTPPQPPRTARSADPSHHSQVVGQQQDVMTPPPASSHCSSSSIEENLPVGRVTPKTTFPRGKYSNSPPAWSPSPTWSSTPPKSCCFGDADDEEHQLSPLKPAGFRTSYTSDRVSNKYTALSQVKALDGSGGSIDHFEGSWGLRVPSSARQDLNMEAQLMIRQDEIRNRRRELCEQDRIAAKREQRHDMVHLKSLVGEGMRYQFTCAEPSAFVKKIMAASVASVRARAPGTCRLISNEQATNHDFVSRTLHRDIETIYPEYGYGSTLQAIFALKMWDRN